MKTIILVRHAKSSWENPSLDDFDRPLNKRGKRDAPFMGKKLKERNILPDAIVSSQAKRARKTAKEIAKAIGYPKKRIVFHEELYHADATDLLSLVKKLDNGIKTVMLFGHNNTFNEFAELLLAQNPVYNIPTTGVYSIGFSVDRWEKVSAGKGESNFFDYPKRYLQELARLEDSANPIKSR